MKEQLDGIQLSGITSMVDEAIKAGKFTADKKNHFVELGKKVGAESLKMTLDAMSVSMKPSTILNKPSASGTPKQYQKLSEVPEAELKLMREEDKEQYKRLYKAEYGFECNI